MNTDFCKKNSPVFLCLKSNTAYISVPARCYNFLLAVLVNCHTLTLAAATETTGQPVIEVFM